MEITINWQDEDGNSGCLEFTYNEIDNNDLAELTRRLGQAIDLPVERVAVQNSINTFYNNGSVRDTIFLRRQ